MGHRRGKDLAQEKEVSSRRWIDKWMVGATGREKAEMGGRRQTCVIKWISHVLL